MNADSDEHGEGSEDLQPCAPLHPIKNARARAKQIAFLTKVLAHGNTENAASAANVPLSVVSAWRRVDNDFALALKAAQQISKAPMPSTDIDRLTVDRHGRVGLGGHAIATNQTARGLNAKAARVLLAMIGPAKRNGKCAKNLRGES